MYALLLCIALAGLNRHSHLLLFSGLASLLLLDCVLVFLTVKCRIWLYLGCVWRFLGVCECGGSFGDIGPISDRIRQAQPFSLDDQVLYPHVSMLLSSHGSTDYQLARDKLVHLATRKLNDVRGVSIVHSDRFLSLVFILAKETDADRADVDDGDLYDIDYAGRMQLEGQF